MTGNNGTRIIPVASNDEPHGVCWQSMSATIAMAMPPSPGGIMGSAQPQPIKIGTEVACIGERCQLWDKSYQQCSAKTANTETEIIAGKLTNSIDEITAALRMQDKNADELRAALNELTNELREIAIQSIPALNPGPKPVTVEGPVNFVAQGKKS